MGAIASGAGAVLGGSGGIGEIGDTLEGKDESKATSGSEQTFTSGFSTDQLVLDPLAITRIIEEVLGGTQGLAAIFGGEQQAGIFDSSVAAQAAGDLSAKLVGELAKLTGQRITTKDEGEGKVFSEATNVTSVGLVEKLLGFKQPNVLEATLPPHGLKDVFDTAVDGPKAPTGPSVPGQFLDIAGIKGGVQPIDPADQLIESSTPVALDPLINKPADQQINRIDLSELKPVRR